MEDITMASINQITTDVQLTLGQIKANGTVEREARRLVCQIFSLTNKELNEILEKQEAWTSRSNNHSKHYNKISSQLFNI